MDKTKKMIGRFERNKSASAASKLATVLKLDDADVYDVSNKTNWKEVCMEENGAYAQWWYEFIGNSSTFKTGKYYLLKQDAGYEVAAYRLAWLLDSPHAKYLPAQEEGKKYVLSEDVLGENEQMLSGNNVFARSGWFKQEKEFHQICSSMKSYLKTYGKERFYETLERDFIMQALKASFLLNIDFYEHNCNFVSNYRTGDIRLSPSMDYGCCLLYSVKDKGLDSLEGKHPEKYAAERRNNFPIYFASDGTTKIEFMEGVSKKYPGLFQEFAEKVEMLNSDIIRACFNGLEDYMGEKGKEDSIRLLKQQVEYVKQLYRGKPENDNQEKITYGTKEKSKGVREQPVATCGD